MSTSPASGQRSLWTKQTVGQLAEERKQLSDWLIEENIEEGWTALRQGEKRSIIET